MVFASIEFLTLFLPIFLILYLFAPAAWRNATLLCCSWVFYGWWSPAFLLMFMALALGGWIGGLAIERAGDRPLRHWVLALFIAANLSLLCWFKYSNILVETIHGVRIFAGFMPQDWQRVILPIGLSFIVLQSISYLIDVYRRTVPADHSFTSFGAYQSMFVHLIAGPIIRYEWVKRELNERPFDWPHFCLGTRRFMVGFSMKVLVGDTLAPVVDAVFALPHPSFFDAWTGCVFYGLQLFFDFAGYSAMAIGLGMMLGFRFPENFDNPYIAKSIQDFWRRWHLSLSTWLRDYLYIPLGGNRHGNARTYVNLFLTMSIAGLWHGGDSWNYLIWGVAHGLALCVDRVWTRANMPDLPVIFARVATLLFVFLAWTIFRSKSVDGALAMYAGQFAMSSLHYSDEVLAQLRPVHWLAAAIGVACVVFPVYYPRLAQRVAHPVLTLGAMWPLFGFVLSFALIASRGAVPFLYFQF